jgi:branched-subunit amino acid aminotransferase/4-amino-4-deoxychorismate lyase
VLDLAPALGLSIDEGPLELAALCGAEEVFLTSSLADLVPVVRVDEVKVGSGAPGPVWQSLLEAYLRRARGEPGR